MLEHTKACDVLKLLNIAISNGFEIPAPLEANIEKLALDAYSNPMILNYLVSHFEDGKTSFVEALYHQDEDGAYHAIGSDKDVILDDEGCWAYGTPVQIRLFWALTPASERLMWIVNLFNYFE